jgi:hypothetical protein
MRANVRSNRRDLIHRPLLFEFESQKQDMIGKSFNFEYWIQKSDMGRCYVILKSSILRIVFRDKEKISHIYVFMDNSRCANIRQNR